MPSLLRRPRIAPGARESFLTLLRRLGLDLVVVVHVDDRTGSRQQQLPLPRQQPAQPNPLRCRHRLEAGRCQQGGLIANGEPIGASGLRQVHEIVLQLRGQAGERQVPGNPKVGYTQLYGAPGTAGVSILSR